jgi:hypothetical protein
MATERSLGAIAISTLRGSLQFGDQGITTRNLFRTHRIGWAEVRRFTDWAADGWVHAGDGIAAWALAIVLHSGRSVMAWGTVATVAPSRSLVAIGQAAQLYDIPADLTGTIERGSFPATLLGASGTITVTVRDGRLAVDGSEAILEVAQRTEPVQPGDILVLSHGGTEVEVQGIRQMFAGGRWEQVAYVYLL